MTSPFSGLESNVSEPLHASTEWSPLQTAWQHKGKIVMVTAIFLALGFVYFEQSTPVYESKAQVLVVRKRPDVVTGIDTPQLSLEDYLATHQVLLHSTIILERAVRKCDPALECFAQSNEGPHEAIRKSLAVTRSKDNILNLSFRGTNPEECAVILNAVIGSYKEFLDETYRKIGQDTLRLVTQARDILHKELTEKEEAHRKFLTETPYLVSKNKGGSSLRQDGLGFIEMKRVALLVREAELQGQLNAMDVVLKNPGGREAILALIAAWSNPVEGPSRAQLQSLQDQLYPLLMEEQKLLQTHGPKSPEVETLRKRIEVTRAFLSSPSAPWRHVTVSSENANGVDPIEQFRLHCQQQLQHNAITEQLLTQLFQKEQDRAQELTGYELTDEGFRTDIERWKKLYDSVSTQLQQIDLAKDVGGYDASVVSPPGVGKKMKPNPLTIFPGSVLLGMMVGFALAYLAEMRDHRFRTIEEVRRSLRLPVVGQIPSFKPAARTGHDPALDPMLCTYHHPGSKETEAYRDVRTALCFGAGSQGRKVIQIVSADERDGSTTLAANLAVTLAQSGKRTLLIDANFRRPCLHKVFGLEESSGVADVLAGQTDPNDFIQSSEIPGLWILPCGPRPANPAELLTSPHLEEVLLCLRGSYDFVLIDTPALLTVTDPRVVAPRVDGILFNIRLTGNGRPRIERARSCWTR
jgi:capsular exopolysaccharide synthesis family protein